MITSRQLGLFLYFSMAFLHFLLGAINFTNTLILVTQSISSAFWLYMATIEFDKE